MSYYGISVILLSNLQICKKKHLYEVKFLSFISDYLLLAAKHNNTISDHKMNDERHEEARLSLRS